MIETAINGEPRARGRAAHLATNAAVHRRSYFCSVSISHLLLPIFDCRLPIRSLHSTQLEIGNWQLAITYRSCPASISIGRQRNARPCLYTHRACAAYAFPRRPAPASAYRCPTRSRSSDTAEYFPWSSDVPPSLRFLPVEGIRS